jgi:hypothetical protein
MMPEDKECDGCGLQSVNLKFQLHQQEGDHTCNNLYVVQAESSKNELSVAFFASLLFICAFFSFLLHTSQPAQMACA